MEHIDKALRLLTEIDKLYSEVIFGNKDVIDELDELILKILEYDDLEIKNEEDKEILALVINSFSDKVNLIYKIINTKKKSVITMDELREEFKLVETRRFDAVNKYVMGVLNVSDLEDFKSILFSFRKKLYDISISDNNIIEIAKMKSKIQHFDTEVLEDEDVLRVAYSNSN